MDKINFVNGTTPALNQTNLNKLQDNVEDAIQEVQDDTDTKLDTDNLKSVQTTSDTDTYSCNYLNDAIKTPNIITAGLGSNVTLSSSNYETISLSSDFSIGTKLSMSNGGIKIGAGVTKIKISAKASFNSVQTSGLKWLTISKNEDTALSANPCILSARNMIFAPVMLTDVTTNDIIYLTVQGVSGDVIRGGVAYTELTVEVVE